MKRIADKSVDMIICDLPYGTTANKWDAVIPFEPLWAQYKRIIKEGGAIVLSASQPFTSRLVASNYEQFRYEWIWEKTRFSNQMLAKKQPLKIHENILVFSKGKCPYYPQNLIRVDKQTRQGKKVSDNIGGGERSTSYYQEFTNYPRSIQCFKNQTGLHSTQKPVALFEYLIKTYTNEGETVLDNCMGSGTTAIACMNTKRNFIGFELDSEYHRIATERIQNECALSI
jgi:site-specific DNA-methyltransferase (adenine-specific)